MPVRVLMGYLIISHMFRLKTSLYRFEFSVKNVVFWLHLADPRGVI